MKQMTPEQIEKRAACELSDLVKASNEAYFAFHSAILFAPKTPEFERLRLVNDNLRKAIVRASQQVSIRDPLTH